MAESEEELKSLLMKVKEESEKAGLKPSIQETKIMLSSPTTSWLTVVETMETVKRLSFSWVPKSLWTVTAVMKLRRLLLGKKPRQCIKKQRRYFAYKGLSSQSHSFSSRHVWMSELHCKEG